MSVYIPKLAFRSDFSSFNSLYLSLPLFHVTARLVWTATFLADSRQLRQLGAKCDKLSRIPREWRRRKIFTPRMPVGRSSFLSLYQLPWPSVSFAYPSFPHRPRFPLTQASFRTYASTRTRLSTGQKYLHKSTMQSLFIFLRKHASNIHDRGEYTLIYALRPYNFASSSLLSGWTRKLSWRASKIHVHIRKCFRDGNFFCCRFCEIK